MSQLIRHSLNLKFLHRSVLLTRKILNQDFIETRLRSTSTLKHFWSLPSFDTPLSCLTDHHGYWHLYTMLLLSWVLFITWYDIGYIMMGAACGTWNVYPSGAPDFTSGFHRVSCCPVICVSLFHVIVLSFGFWVLIVPFVWLSCISIYCSCSSHCWHWCCSLFCACISWSFCGPTIWRHIAWARRTDFTVSRLSV